MSNTRNDSVQNSQQRPAPRRACTGPRTALGKKRSCVNAVRHGIFTKELQLAPDERREYDALRASLEKELKPNSPLLGLLFENFLAATWRVKIADRCTQEGITKRVQDAPQDSHFAHSGEINFPFQLTSFELKRRIALLGDIAQHLSCHGRLTGDMEKLTEKALGTAFLRTLHDWEPLDPTLIRMNENLLAKQRIYDLEPVVQPPAQEKCDEYRAIEGSIRIQTLLKLTQLKQQDFQLALQFVQETGERSTVVKDRLEIFLRYQTAARRDFYRALHEYRQLKWPSKSGA